MAGNPENTESALQGDPIVIDRSYYQYAGGPLVNAVTPPAVKIFNPLGAQVAAGTATLVSTGYYEFTYVIPSDAQPSNQWKIRWEAMIGAIPVVSEEYFIVLPVTSTPAASITISDAWLNQVKKVLAYPKVNNVLLDDTEIRDLCVLPALHRYSMKFPKEARYEQELNQELVLPFPDNATYGVLDCRVVQKSGAGSNSSFWDIIKYQNLYKSSPKGGYYGTHYNFNGLRQAHQMKQLEFNTYKNLNTFKYYVNHANRTLEIYSSTTARINVTWAKEVTDFADVKFVHRFEVIQLAQAELLYQLADATSIVDNGAEINVDSDTLKSRAEALRQEVIELWSQIPDVVVVRSGAGSQ